MPDFASDAPRLFGTQGDQPLFPGGENTRIEPVGLSPHSWGPRFTTARVVFWWDALLPGHCGFSLENFMFRTRRAEQVIFISQASDVRVCVRALKAGAVDFLVKPLKDVELSEAVETALRQSRELLRLQEDQRAAETLLNKLTPREREVLELVTAGRMNKEIAADLGTSEKTIKKHRGQVMRKLQVGCAAELVGFAIRHGVTSEPAMRPKSHIQPQLRLIA